MKKIIFGFIAGILFINSGFAKIETVKATGYGDDESVATINAIDNAIRQTNTVSVSGGSAKISSGEINIKNKKKSWWESSKSENTELKADYKISSRDIDMKYKGQIDGYTVLKTYETNGKYAVDISANVFVADDYVSPGLGNKTGPKIAITGFDGQLKWDCLTESEISESFKNTIVKSKKMTLVDRENMDKQLKELGLLDTDLANRNDKNKQGKIEIADYIMVGKINDFEIIQTEKSIEKTGEKIQNTDVKIDVSYRLIELATSTVVSTERIVKNKNYDTKVSCDTVAKKIGAQIGDELANEMLVDIFPDYKPADSKPSKKTWFEKHKKSDDAPRPTVKLPGDL